MRYPVHAFVARLLAPSALLAALAGSGAAAAQEVDYSRAERFLTWNTERMIAGAEVVPNWMETGDTDRFWYRNNTGSGYEFILVNPSAGSREPLFDHYRLAGAMSLANDTSYVPDQLPFSTFSFGGSESEIEFTRTAGGSPAISRVTPARWGTRSPRGCPSWSRPTGAGRRSRTSTICTCARRGAGTRSG